ncbi:hypothetical protein DXB24_23415 [Lachnospiraceae bacterium OM02-3]|nr:hypothetical protein DXB24_23415 [Lachnospiraceae bacterium OM02-3]
MSPVSSRAARFRPPGSLPAPCPRRRPPNCKVPCRGRFRSDNHAAVLRLQNTQPKDRRDYDAPFGNPCSSAACAGDKGPEGSREGETGQRGRTPGTRTAALTFFSSPFGSVGSIDIT